MLERLVAGLILIGALLWGASLMATPGAPEASLDAPEAEEPPAATGEAPPPAAPPSAKAPAKTPSSVRETVDDDEDDEEDEDDDEKRGERGKGKRKKARGD